MEHKIDIFPTKDETLGQFAERLFETRSANDSRSVADALAEHKAFEAALKSGNLEEAERLGKAQEERTAALGVQLSHDSLALGALIHKALSPFLHELSEREKVPANYLLLGLFALSYVRLKQSGLPVIIIEDMVEHFDRHTVGNPVMQQAARALFHTDDTKGA